MASESDKAPPAAEAAPTPTPGAAAAEAPPEKKQEKESIWSFLRFLLILGVITLLVRSLLFAPFSIPSGSMLPNLMIGDYLFVAKWPYGYSRYSFPFGIAQYDGRVMGALPERGDIAVFRYPGPRNEDFVKRVIGLPGDTIEMRGGATILNGQPVQRQAAGQFVVPVSENSPCSPYPGSAARLIATDDGTPACSYPLVRETLPGGRSFDTIDQFPASEGDNVAPFTVPEGHVFVMGDNRDDSLDGRFAVARGGVGLLPLENLQGRALISFWSTDGSAEWLLPWTWFTAARFDRIGQTYP